MTQGVHSDLKVLVLPKLLQIWRTLKGLADLGTFVAWTLGTSKGPRLPKTCQETKPYSGLGQLLSSFTRKRSFNQRHLKKKKWLLARLNSKCCLWGQSYKLPKSNDSLGIFVIDAQIILNEPNNSIKAVLLTQPQYF